MAHTALAPMGKRPAESVKVAVATPPETVSGAEPSELSAELKLTVPLGVSPPAAAVTVAVNFTALVTVTLVESAVNVVMVLPAGLFHWVTNW